MKRAKSDMREEPRRFSSSRVQGLVRRLVLGFRGWFGGSGRFGGYRVARRCGVARCLRGGGVRLDILLSGDRRYARSRVVAVMARRDRMIA